MQIIRGHPQAFVSTFVQFKSRYEIIAQECMSFIHKGLEFMASIYVRTSIVHESRGSCKPNMTGLRVDSFLIGSHRSNFWGFQCHFLFWIGWVGNEASLQALEYLTTFAMSKIQCMSLRRHHEAHARKV